MHARVYKLLIHRGCVMLVLSHPQSSDYSNSKNMHARVYKLLIHRGCVMLVLSHPQSSDYSNSKNCMQEFINS